MHVYVITGIYVHRLLYMRVSVLLCMMKGARCAFAHRWNSSAQPVPPIVKGESRARKFFVIVMGVSAVDSESDMVG